LQHLFDNPDNLFVGGKAVNEQLGRDISSSKRERDAAQAESDPKAFGSASARLAKAEVDVGKDVAIDTEKEDRITGDDTNAIKTIDDITDRLPRLGSLSDEADRVNRGLAQTSLRLRKAQGDQTNLNGAISTLAANVRQRKSSARARMESALKKGAGTARRLGEILATKNV